MRRQPCTRKTFRERRHSSTAPAAVKFIAAYAASESRLGSLGIRFISVLPNLTAATALGAPAVAAYARRQGVSTAAFLASRGPVLTPERVGSAIVELVVDTRHEPGAYSLDAGDLTWI